MNAELVLYEEEFLRISKLSARLCSESQSRSVFIIDKNGQVIASAGEVDQLDTTSLGSLGAGEIAATGGIAQLIGEKEFSTLFHEGDRDNLHLSLVGNHVILVLIFDAKTSLGLVRLRVRKCSDELVEIFEEIQRRSEEAGTKSPIAEMTEEDIDNLFSM